MDGQADLSLRWADSPFVDFVMSWLIYKAYSLLQFCKIMRLVLQLRKRGQVSGDGNGNTDMSNKNTGLTDDKVWGLDNGESNGYTVLDAKKVSTMIITKIMEY